MRRLLWMIALLLLAPLVALPANVRAAPDRGPIPVGPNDPALGSAHAPVTLVVFADLECPFCKVLHDRLGELQKRYDGRQLRIVLKHFPLAFHKKARPAAEAAEAVRQLHGDKALWAYVDEAYQQLRSGGDYRSVLAARGIDAVAVERLMKSGKPAKKVDEDEALGKRIGVTGTPASFINGIKVSGAVPIEKLVETIDEQLAAAKQERKRGTPPAGLYAALTKANYKPAPPPAPAPPSPAQDTTTVWKVPVGSSPALGPKNALVTLVVFSDIQCPFCARLHPTLLQLQKEYPRELRIVFKHNPLPFHKRAEPAAQLALEARKQRGDGAFWSSLDKLFANQKALEDADLERAASDLGLDPARAMAAVRRSAHAAVIEADQDLADELEARGTPCSFVNGRRLTGARPIESFREVIDEEIAHAKKLMAGGVPAARLYDHIMRAAKTPAPAPLKQIPAPSAAGHPVRGSARAPVTIHMFTDFECPFCGRVQQTLAEVEKEFGTQVRLVFHHMPLDMHAHAMAAHEAAAEAFRQGGNTAFWKLHDRLYQHQGDLDRAALLDHGRHAGLDVAELERALDSGRHKKAIQKDMAVAEKADITGTPAFVINGYFLSGAQPLSKFKRVIRRALADAKAGRKAG